MDGTKKGDGSEKMVWRWSVSDVDGLQHEKMKIQQIATATRNIRGAMEEGRWKMWTARCDQVHRKEDDDTITEKERVPGYSTRVYAKIKKSWVQQRGHEKNG